MIGIPAGGPQRRSAKYFGRSVGHPKNRPSPSDGTESFGTSRQRPDYPRLRRFHMTKSKLVDCPVRPPCPVCGMKMVTTNVRFVGNREQCSFECMRCGHIETSEPG